MAASHLQPITEVAKPVIERPASSAHSGVAAVMTTREPHIGNASANVSTISAPCSFIPRPPSCGLEQPRLAHRIARELHAVAVLEQLLQRGLDALVVLGADPQQAARAGLAQLAVLDDVVPVLDDVARRGEHRLAVGVVDVDRDVGVGAHAEVALVARGRAAAPARPA